MTIGKDLIEDIKRKNVERMKQIRERQLIKKQEDENTGVQQ